MNATFWTNTIWYLILGVITSIALVVGLLKADNPKKALAFFLVIAGVALNYETLILIFLKSYAYYPKILIHPPYAYDDSLAGNLFSQSSVGTATMVVAVFNLNFYWIWLIVAAFAGVEEAFLALGIYQHYWYKTWMTTLGLFILFWVAKTLYRKLDQNGNRLLYYACIYSALFPLNVIILAWGIFVLFRIQDFNTTLFSDPFHSRHLLFLVQFWLLAIPTMYLYFKKIRWIWQAPIILLMYSGYYLGYKLHLFIIRDGWYWFWIVSTVSIVWMYASIVFLDKFLSSKSHKKAARS
jgi:hypothetical protein